MQIRGKLVDGTVRDVSAGGLSVQIDQSVEHGDSLNLTLNLDSRRKIDVQCIVWSVRGFKRSPGSTTLNRLGLVLSKAPDSFMELLPTPKPKLKKSESTRLLREERMPEAKRSALFARLDEKKPPDCPKTNCYKIRVQLDRSNRTRSIIVFAEDEDEARKCAGAEIGAGWQILDVDLA